MCIFNDPYIHIALLMIVQQISQYVQQNAVHGQKEAPHHFQDEEVLLETKQKFGEKNGYRSFQVQWYKDYPWLTLCIKPRTEAFCIYLQTLL